MGQTRAMVGAGPAPVTLPGKDYQAVGLHIWKVTPSTGLMLEKQAALLEAWVPSSACLFAMSSGHRHL